MLPDAAIRNRVLSLLPPPELKAVLERAEMVTIESKEIAYEREQPIRFAHFPEDCVISLVTELESGDQIEAMAVGNDGFTSIAMFHGLTTSKLKAIGQISGHSRRVARRGFQEAHDRVRRLQSPVAPLQPFCVRDRSAVRVVRVLPNDQGEAD